MRATFGEDPSAELERARENVAGAEARAEVPVERLPRRACDSFDAARTLREACEGRLSAAHSL